MIARANDKYIGSDGHERSLSARLRTAKAWARKRVDRNGRKRPYKPITRRPELAGLIGNDYHRAHMKIWRKERRKQ